LNYSDLCHFVSSCVELSIVCDLVCVMLVPMWLLMVVRTTRSRSALYGLTTTPSCVYAPSTVISLLSASCQSSITDTKVALSVYCVITML